MTEDTYEFATNSGDRAYLSWLYDRLRVMYEEPPGVDYMITLRNLADGINNVVQDAAQWHQQKKAPRRVAMTDEQGFLLECAMEFGSIVEDEDDGRTFYLFSEKKLIALLERIRDKSRRGHDRAGEEQGARLTDWNRRYMDLARLVAAWSKDPTSQVGAVVVGRDPREIAVGYNGFPRGIADDKHRLRDRTTKHYLIQHAERNVLDNARFDLTGATIVTTRFPCHECAKSIVSRGVARVVCPPMPEDPLWRESSEWAMKILEEAYVIIKIVYI